MLKEHLKKSQGSCRIWEKQRETSLPPQKHIRFASGSCPPVFQHQQKQVMRSKPPPFKRDRFISKKTLKYGVCHQLLVGYLPVNFWSQAEDMKSSRINGATIEI